MKTIILKPLLLIFILLINQTIFADTDLQKYIPMIISEYPQNIISKLYMMKKVINDDNDKNNKKLKTIIDKRINGYPWVNGFVIKDNKDKYYIITQGDLINETNTVSIVFLINDKVYLFKNIPILFIDKETLIAVVKVPTKIKKYIKGFELSSKKYMLNTPITVVGYKSNHFKPEWKVLKGIQLSGGHLDIDLPGEGKFLIHSIKPSFIDEGEPVLVKDKTTSKDFLVIGINILQDHQDMIMTIAFPEKAISNALLRYKKSVKIQKNTNLLKQELLNNIKLFQYILNNNQDDFTRIRVLNYLISYKYAFTHGHEIMSDILKYFKDDDNESTKITGGYIMMPTFSLKNTIIYRINLEVRYNNPHKMFYFAGLNLKKDSKLTTDTKITSYFSLTDRKIRIVWIFEQGTWKIDNVEFTPIEIIIKNKNNL